MKINTESKIDFDNSVTTEDRFALRRWFKQLVDEINYNDRFAYAQKLSPMLHVEGFTAQPLTYETFNSWLQAKSQDWHIRVMRYPELKARAAGDRFYLSGTYEEFFDGVLAYEGTIDVIIVKEEGKFLVWSQKFYPRLMLKQ